MKTPNWYTWSYAASSKPSANRIHFRPLQESRRPLNTNKGERHRMKRFLPSGLMIFAGVLGIAAAAANADQDVTKIRKKFDLRETILRRFFKENHAPAERYAGVFVSEADTYNLDWRLLPSLSMVESGGGKYARGNNLFGWANGKWNFRQHQRGCAPCCRDAFPREGLSRKGPGGKLRTYNHRCRLQKHCDGRDEKNLSQHPDVESRISLRHTSRTLLV